MGEPGSGFLGDVHGPLDACWSGHFKVIICASGGRGGAFRGSLDGRIYSCLSRRKDCVLDVWISLAGGQDGSGEQGVEDEACEDLWGPWLE